MVTQDRKYFERRRSQLELEKSSYIGLWRDESDFIAPFSARFLVTDRRQAGMKRATKILDNTASIAVGVLSAGLMSGVTNPTRPWIQMRMQDPTLNKMQVVKAWLDDCKKVMMETFLKSNLYSVLPQVYASLAVFGTATLSVMEHHERGIWAEHFPVGSYALGRSGYGTIDSIYRERQWSVWEMVERFGKDACSAQVQSAFDAGNMDQLITVIHAVEPNHEWDDGKLSSGFKKWLSVYYENGQTEKDYLTRKGFDEFPILAPRWETVGEDTYGFGPGAMALGDVKSLQTMDRRSLQAVDKKVTPAMVAPPAMRKKKISALSGDITYVEETAEGKGIREMYKVNLDIRELEMKAEQTRSRIKKAFYSDLFLLISSLDKSGITATEIAARKEEQLLALGPVYLKLNDELLDPLVERTFSILLRQGKIPVPPAEIQGKPWTVEYISVLSQSMKAVGVQNLERAVSFLGAVAQADPSVLDGFSGDDAWEEYADMTAIAPRIVRDAATRKRIRDQRAQADRAKQSMEMAQQGADVAQKLGNSPLGDNNALAQIVQRMQGAPALQGAPA